MSDANGRPLAFEIMTQNTDQEKLAVSYQRSLQLLGIAATIRTVDDSQYQSRTNSFDYDVIVEVLHVVSVSGHRTAGTLVFRGQGS